MLKCVSIFPPLQKNLKHFHMSAGWINRIADRTSKAAAAKTRKKIPVLIIPHETLWHSSISSASESPPSPRRWKLGGRRQKKKLNQCVRKVWVVLRGNERECPNPELRGRGGGGLQVFFGHQRRGERRMCEPWKCSDVEIFAVRTRRVVIWETFFLAQVNRWRRMGSEKIHFSSSSSSLLLFQVIRGKIHMHHQLTRIWKKPLENFPRSRISRVRCNS